MREIRNRIVGLRFTQKEFEKLMMKMELAGYQSISIFIRDALLSTRLQRRNYSKTDANTARQVAMLRSELRQIGVNYNQRIKALNTLAKLRDRNGQLIINARDIDRDTTEMKQMMERMVEILLQVQSCVTETDSPESGDSDNSSLTSK